MEGSARNLPVVLRILLGSSTNCAIAGCGLISRLARHQSLDLQPQIEVIREVQVYIQNASLTQALAALEKAKREREGDQVLNFSTGMVHAAQGKRTEALHVVRELEEMSGASHSQAQYIARDPTWS